MGKAAKGTLLKVGDGGGTEVFTTLAEVTDISGPGLSGGIVEISHMESTYKEYDNTYPDGGEVSVSGNFLPAGATHQALLDDYVAGTLRNFKIVWSDGSSTEWAFSAYVTKYEPSAPLNGKLSFSATLTISGAPTLPA